MKNLLLSLCLSGCLPLAASTLPIVVNPATPLTGTYAVEWNGSNLESWTTSQITGVTVSGGNLSGTTSGTDPQITRTIPTNSRPDLDLGFNDFLELRMQVPANYADDIQIYYGTTATTGFSGGRLILIPNTTIPKDGAFHTYRIDVGPEPLWRASLQDLRIDPGNASGVPFAIDYLRVGDEPNPTVYQPRFTTKCPAAGGATPADAYLGPGQAVSSMESKHFRFIWNNNVTTQPAWNSSMAKGTLRNLEEAWQVFVKVLGYREPCFNVGTTSGTAYKLNVTSYYDGFWAGLDDHGGTSLAQLNIGPVGLQVDPPTWVVPHELMHCLQFHNTSGNVNGEWYETHANYARERWLQHYQVLYPNRSNIEALGVRDGHFMMSSGRNLYLTWPFMYYVDTNPDNLPDLSEGMIKRVWQETQPGEFAMTALDRITPTTSLKDLSGYYARRCATWDFSNQTAMTAELNTQDPTRNARHLFTDLIQRPDAPTWWRVPPNKAPAQGAYAMHELIPAGSGAGRVVTVNLQGLADSARGADWRASLVAVSDTGVERYTPLWSNGSSSITLAADENKLYLSVAGTPDAYLYGGHDEVAYRFRSHPSRSRFHYEVQVTGATPRERNNGSTSGLVLHSNGGGYKASTATVASTAFIGPNARVLGNAVVDNTARIEDYAVVTENAWIRNRAVVGGHAWVRGSAVIQSDARVRDWAIVDSGTITGNARVLEHATVGGNMQDTAVAKGSALHQSGGTLSGNAIVDGDYMANKSLTGGVTFGHLPFVGVPDNFTTATPAGLYAAYNFRNAHDSRALDQYGVTDGFTLGSPAWSSDDGERRGFLTFNGSNQFIALDRSVADSRAFSFSAWVKPTGGAANQAVLWLGTSSTRRLSLTASDSSGQAKFSIVNGGAEQTLVANALPTGTWSHIAVTLNGATGVLYVNGSSVASGSITLRPDQLLAANTSTGTQHNYLARAEGSAMPMFQGSLDDAQFYSSALTSTQITALATPPVPVGNLMLSDSFTAESYDAGSFNNNLATDQQGYYAPTAYSLVTGGQGWHAQHGAGGTMLLVGDAGYNSRASLNEDFALVANEFDQALAFQVDAWVDTGNDESWSSVVIGTGQNLNADSGASKFAIRPVRNGSLQVWVNGTQLPLASRSGNTFRIILSDTEGSGSAFNGNGSKAALYNGATLVGTYTLPQLGPGDGYITFGAQPNNGYTLTRIDNLNISRVPLTSFTWAGGTGDWTDLNWLPGSVTGPTVSGLTGVVNAGTVTLGQATLGSFAASATIGAGAMLNLHTATNIALDTAVAFSGAGAISKSGAGTLTLSSAHSYTGGTTLNDGTLKLLGSAFSTTAQAYSIASGAVLNLDGNTNFASGITTISGDGTLRISGGQFTAGADGRDLTLAMSGGLIDIQAGAAMDNGGWQSVTWTDNKASLNVNGTFDVWDGQNVFVDALTGSGSVTIGNVTWSALNTTLSVGLNGGSGTFGGVISGTGSGDDTLNLTKQGGGSQTLSGANTYTGLTNIHAGTLVAANNTALGAGGHNGNTMTYIHDGATLAMQGGISLDEHFHVWGAGVSGLGAVRSISGNNTLSNSPGGGPGFNLRSNTTVGVDADTLTVSGFYDHDGGGFGITKVGAGTLTLKAACTYAGSTTVSAGTLLVDTTGSLGSGSLTVANNAICELRNPSGGVANHAVVTLNGTGSLNLASGVTETVGTLVIDGIPQARGTWNATRDPVHFTGTGALLVTDGPAPDADGAWTSLADGAWNQTGSWQNGDVAKGADKTATFNQSTGATITVDGSRTIGHLVFDGSDYRLVGDALTLASTSGTSTISVASSRSAFISAVLTGSVGLLKTGDGTLALGGTNSYAGATTVSAGTLRVTADTSAGVTIANAGFESPVFGDGGWSYTPSAAGWSFNAAGIGRNGSPWVTTAPQGLQVGFVQGSGNLSQSLTVTTGGFYDLSFKAANRPNYPDSGIAIQIDGVTVKSYPAGTFASGGAFQTFVVRGILLEAGSRTLTFAGSLNGGDSATAIDDVSLTGYAAGSLPAGTALALSGGTLQLDVAQTVGTLTGGNGAQLVNRVALTVGDATDTAFAGVISGAGDLVKTGTGTLSLTGTSTYTGNTTVNGGTLRLGNGTSPTDLANSADVIVAAGAMLHLDYTGTDTINALWVDGSQLSPGVYSSTSAFITGSGTLTVATGPAPAGYATWSGSNGYNLSGGPSGDDDNDSIANLLEYVLGGNPLAASSGILPTATATAGNLVFTFRRIQSTTADTTQIFQYGTNLSGWTDVPIVAGGIVAIQPDTPQIGTDTITITVPEGTEPRIFGRLKVSTSPAPQ